LGLLANSPLLLEAVLELVCNPAAPAVPTSKLKAKVIAALRKPFEAAVLRRINDNMLPPAVGCVVVRNKPHLYLTRMPPPPPRKKPEVELAENMVQWLESQRGRGPADYPTTLRKAVTAVAEGADAKVVKKALGTAPFKGRVVLAAPKHPDTPVTLVEDQERLAASPLILEFAMRATRTEATQVFSPVKLKMRVIPALRQAFVDAINRAASESLPPGAGWLPVGGRKHFF